MSKLPSHRSSRPRRLCGRLAWLSVLLAFACFPVAAQADSAGNQYQDRLPSPFGKSSEGNPSSGSNDGGSESASQSSNPEEKGSGGDKGDGDGKGGTAAGGGTASGGGGGSGQPGGSGGKAGLSDSSSVGGANFNSASADDGSSPLVPILIGVAVLAALSGGALWMLSRRQHPPSAPPGVSPDATKAQ